MHETVWKGRKLVLRDKETGEFFDDFSGNTDQKETVRQMLGLEEEQVVELSGDNSKYEVPLPDISRHNTAVPTFAVQGSKDGRAGTRFKNLYVAFFNADNSFIKSKEHGSGNTALHMACRHGHFDIVLYLLENGADIDMSNNHHNTPFSLATESLPKRDLSGKERID
ncbi:hypothetical protein OS493_038976 [Desmophyllum pertusum]|uniref:Ankyrin repeat domain-containing protein n=1 Tax=Desmophyllum pertusum TaxID=174260 RepID=A0A9X0D002_9CNID|nr:hypothetical protein OS493_038976 [Desmophyllum pertusum]